MRWIRLHFPKYVVSIIMLNSIGIYKYWDFHIKTKILETKMLYVLKTHLLYSQGVLYICKIHTYLIFKAYLWEILGGKSMGKSKLVLQSPIFEMQIFTECLHAMTNLDSMLKSRDITLPTKVCIAKAMVFPVVMYGYESWTIKKSERWIHGAFELWHWRRLLRVPWIAKRSNTVNPKGNQAWIFTGKTDAKAEAPILFLVTWYEDPIHSLEKTLMLGDWGQEAKGVTEDKTVEWHHWLNGHEFDQAPGDGEGQGSLLRCSSCGNKELDRTVQLNNNNNRAPIMC